MPKRSRTEPRKSPKQARSRQLVEVLLEATARVLAKEGWRKATTNRIAEVAGVTVGSLYQYFPSKESLVAALLDRHLEQLMARVMTGLMQSDSSLETQVNAVVCGYLDGALEDVALHRALLEQVPNVERTEAIRRFRQQAIDAVKALLGSSSTLDVADAERIAFVAVHAIDALKQASLRERPEWLADPAYRRDICRLVLLFLESALPASQKPS
jgi:AcrR family transcriptional regulator